MSRVAGGTIIVVEYTWYTLHMRAFLKGVILLRNEIRIACIPRWEN